MSGPAHLDRVLAAFPGARRSGNAWSALCPVHDDHKPSLTIAMGTQKPDYVLVQCGAGCSHDDVLAAVGLTAADCWPEQSRSGSKALRRHPYVDAEGVVQYEVRRYERASNKFAYWHPTAAGWAKGRGDGPKLLYRLPQLLSEPDTMNVWITEGERDADTLAETCGVLATTVASGSWSDVDLTALNGKHVVVVIDNDRRGWERGHQAIKAAEEAGALIADVWRPHREFNDVTEAIRAGRTCDTGFDSVDLRTDTPFYERRPEDEPRPFITAQAENGTALFSMTPTELILDEALSATDLRVWTAIDARAGRSGIALTATAANVAWTLRIDKATAARSIKTLIECGWLDRPKRGKILVINPARGHRSSERERSLQHPSFSTRPTTRSKEARTSATSVNSGATSNDSEVAPMRFLDGDVT